MTTPAPGAQRARKAKTASRRPSERLPATAHPGARDRLLAALESTPRLSQKDADSINRVVQEARELSLADQLPA